MAFSIAVAIPISNHKFDKPTFVSATLASSILASEIEADLTAVYPTSTDAPLTMTLKRGDTLTLTSSVASYLGYTEQAVIEKVEAGASTKVTFTEPLTYAYNSGDSVKGYGSGLPDDWTRSAGGTFYHTTMKPPGGGYADNHGFYFFAEKSTSGIGQTIWFAHRDFELPVFSEYCWYRQGAMVRGFLTGASTQLGLSAFSRQQELAGYPSYINNYYFKPTAEDTWEEVSTTFISAPVLSYYIGGVPIRSNRYGNVAFNINIDAANYSYAWACIDDMYLEHMRGVAPLSQSLMNIDVTSAYPVSIMVHNPSDFTVGNIVSVWGRYNSGNAIEGEIIYGQGKIDAISGNRLTVSGLPTGYNWASGAMVEEKNAGVYTFEEHPDMEGVSWEPVSNMALNRTSNNGLKYINPSGWGERTSKVQLTLKFTNVAYTFYRKLKKFEDECKKGNLLNLHQNGDVPELKMPFIQGFMQLTGFTHDMWDRYKCSFTATFLES